MTTAISRKVEARRVSIRSHQEHFTTLRHRDSSTGETETFLSAERVLESNKYFQVPEVLQEAIEGKTFVSFAPAIDGLYIAYRDLVDAVAEYLRTDDADDDSAAAMFNRIRPTSTREPQTWVVNVAD